MEPLAPPRHSPDAPAPDGAPISVAALLRREGRGRHAVDRPLLPRGHSRTAPPPPRHSLRKAGAAAGALFAVGAVFGAAVLDESSDRRGEPGPEARGDGAGPDGPASVGASGPVASLVALATEDPGPVPLPTVSGAGIVGDALAAAQDSSTGTEAPRGLDAPQPGAPPATTLGEPDSPPGQAPGGDDTGGGTPGGGTPGGGTPGGGGAPGGGIPGGGAPGSETPGGGATGGAGSGGGTDGPGPGVTVPLPDLATPPVDVPAVPLPGTSLETPRLSVSEAAVDAPDLSLTGGDGGVELRASRTAVTTPDVQASPVDVGPVGLTDTAAELPDLGIGAETAAPLVAVGPEPELTTPEVTVSSTTVTTPDLRLGDTEIEVPDLDAPELTVPEVPVVETAASTVGSLLGD